MGMLEGEQAVITGGAHGIGRATAAPHGGGGCVGRDHRRRRGRRGARPTAELGIPAFVADVRDPDACTRAIDAAADALGGLTVLFNNAGVGAAMPLHSYPDKVWRRLVDVNLAGTFHGIRAAVPLMLERGGSIVNHASVSGIRPTRFEGPVLRGEGRRDLADDGRRARVRAEDPGELRVAGPRRDQPDGGRSSATRGCGPRIESATPLGRDRHARGRREPRRVPRVAARVRTSPGQNIVGRRRLVSSRTRRPTRSSSGSSSRRSAALRRSSLRAGRCARSASRSRPSRAGAAGPSASRRRPRSPASPCQSTTTPSSVNAALVVKCSGSVGRAAAIAAATVGVLGERVQRHPGRGRELDLERVPAAQRVGGGDPHVVADLAVVDRHRARPARARRRTGSRSASAPPAAGSSARTGPTTSASTDEPGFLGRLAHRGVPARGRRRRSGSSGKSPGSTRPPGNTHMPPANASRESRRSIRVSSPSGASRSRMTVAAATIGAGSAPRPRAPSGRSAPALTPGARPRRRRYRAGGFTGSSCRCEPDLRDPRPRVASMTESRWSPCAA